MGSRAAGPRGEPGVAAARMTAREGQELLEDTRYLGATLAQIQTSISLLSTWLKRVFTLMDGYLFATGLLTVCLALTSFRSGRLAPPGSPPWRACRRLA